MLENGQAFRNFLPDGLRLSAQNVEYCEGPVKSVEVIEVVADCARQKSPGYDGLPDEFYSNMLDFWGVAIAQRLFSVAIE